MHPQHHISRAAYRTLKHLSQLILALSLLYLVSTTEPVSQYLTIPIEGTLDVIGSEAQEALAKLEISSHPGGISQEPAPLTKRTFGKVTASFGEPDPNYEGAIASHTIHNKLHSYEHFILREQMVRGLWSKHSYLITIIGQELAKPDSERLEWLLWHDRDTVLMNPQIPLDIFLPPEPEFGHVHLLVTNDRNGLNNGVFMVRVNQWAFKILASALSIREYQPEIPLKYTEQSGMEETIKRPWWNNSVAYVPQRWFNGFPPSTNQPGSDQPAKIDKPAASRPGSLLIHFASNRDGLRPERMAQWEKVARNRTTQWDRPVHETDYLREIEEYWKRVASGQSMERICKDIGKRVWD